MGPDHAARLGEILRELGLPENYATQRGFSPQLEADETKLVVIGRHPEGREVRLAPRAAAAWERLRTAAAGENVVLVPLSGFRSIARQQKIVREKLSAGQPLAAILRLVAVPGYSEHHTGHALDLGVPGQPPLEEDFAQTAAFAWLARHAGNFGFHLSYPRDNPFGIAYEPWHWCWRE